jgi:hypothetical protein
MAATMAALVIVVSIVIDLGGARNARARDQNMADATAIAGAAKLTPYGGSNQTACQAAWNYMVGNSSLSATPAPSCINMAGTCGTTARQVSTTQGDYTITFVNPVLNDSSLFDGQPATATDGLPCERLGVIVSHVWRHVLATGSTTITVKAIARFMHDPGDVNAPLIVLSPHGCETLSVSGHAHITTNTASGDPGYVAIDSDGADCTTGQKVVVDTTGSAQITADAITMWALSTGNSARAYDPSDVGPGKGFFAAPIAMSAPVGRTSVDWRYNCSASNGCPTAGTPAIDNLIAADGTGAPSGYTTWTSAYSCAPSTELVVPSGNWYIDCGTTGVTSNASITFRGGNIVSQGPFNMNGNSDLRINCDVASAATACPADPSSPSTVFIRSGGMTKAGSVGYHFLETFVYVASGGISLTGNGPLDWTAPDDSTYAFDDLLLWTEQPDLISVDGGTDTVLDGIYFAPNAPMTLTGNTGTNALGTQMFVKTATLAGTTSLTLAPRSDRVLQLGGAGSSLIR